MQCPEFERVSRLLDNTADPEDQRWLESHLSTCSACQQELESVLSLVRTPHADVTSQPPAPEDLRRRLNAVAPPTSFASQESALLEPSDRPEGKGTLGPYEVIRRLGQGAFGVVYLARDPQVNRDFAIKVLRSEWSEDAFYLKRFYSEARLANQVSSPYVVPVLRVGQLPEFPRPCLVMEWVDGQTLRDAVQQQTDTQRRAGFRETALIIARAAEGLDAVHETGLVHRDVKSANILVEAATGVPRLTDFGLARDAASSARASLADGAGTLAYMGPEVIRSGTCDRRSDVYSLGVVLYEALVGRRPFQADSTSALRQQILEEAPMPLRDENVPIPRDLETIALKCLHKDPALRYQTARELADDLQRFLSGKPIHARSVSLAERIGLWCRRNPWPTAAGIALLTATLVVSGLALCLQAALERESRLRREAEMQRNRAAASYRRQIDSLKFFADALITAVPVTPTNRELRSRLEAVYLDHFRRQLTDQAGEPGVYYGDACAAYAYYARAFGRLEEARRYYEQALDVYAAAVPLESTAALTETKYRINLANVCYDLGDAERAYEHLQHAQRRCEQLVRETEDREAIELLSGVFRERGRLRNNDRDWQQALEDYAAAQQHLEKLLRTKADDGKLLQDLAGLKRNQGNTWYDRGLDAKARNEHQEASDHLARAVTALTEAVRIGRETLRETDGDGRLTQELADHYNSLAVVRKNRGEYAQAIQAYQQSVELRRTLLAHDPGNVSCVFGLSRTLNNLGLLHLEQKDLRRAQEAFQEAIALREILVQLRPDDPHYPRGLANTLLLASDLALAQQDADQAQQWTGQAVQVMRESLAGTAENILAARMLTTALQQLASIQIHRKDRDLALQIYREAIDEQQKIVAMPQSQQRDQSNLAALHHDAARLLVETGQAEEALTHYVTAAERWQQLGDAAGFFRAADCYCRCAALAADDQPNAAKRHYVEQALAALHQAVQAGFRDAQALNTEPFGILEREADFAGLRDKLAAEPTAEP
jgi:serine/threonine protein kinase/tetratricopeptide (TPR) repeat protein